MSLLTNFTGFCPREPEIFKFNNKQSEYVRLMQKNNCWQLQQPKLILIDFLKHILLIL